MGATTGKVALGNIFKGLKDARILVNSDYMRAGRYLTRIDKCKIDENRKHEGFFAVEMTVLHVYDDDHGKGHRVAEGVTHLVKRSNDYFLPEIKGFIAGVFGVKAEDVSEDNAVMVFDEDQPLAGTIVEVEGRTIATKKGGDFTRITYRRAVSASEALGILTPEAVERFYPNKGLERMAAAEQAAAAQAGQAA